LIAAVERANMMISRRRLQEGAMVITGLFHIAIKTDARDESGRKPDMSEARAYKAGYSFFDRARDKRLATAA